MFNLIERVSIFVLLASLATCQQLATSGILLPTEIDIYKGNSTNTTIMTQTSSTQTVKPTSMIPFSSQVTNSSQVTTVINSSIRNTTRLVVSSYVTTVHPPNTTISSMKTSSIGTTSVIPMTSSIIHPTSSSEVHFTSTKEFSSRISTMNPSSTTLESSLATSDIHPATRSSTIISSSLPPAPTITPTSQVIVECGEECKTLKKRLYAAAVFAILFLIVALVLGVLLYRQYKISNDYQDDPGLSRLI